MQVKHTKAPAGWTPFDIVLRFENEQEVEEVVAALRDGGETSIADYIEKASRSVLTLPEEKL